MFIAKNKKAYFDYEILESQEAGIELYGYEVKAIRKKHIQLKGSYISVVNNELFVKAMHIGVLQQKSIGSIVDTLRPRKVMLHKKKILSYAAKIKEGGYTLIPLELYFSGSLIKIRVGLAKGKKLYQKKQTLKERTLEKEAKQLLKKTY